MRDPSRTRRDATTGCQAPGQKRREGGLALTGSVRGIIRSKDRPVRALGHIVPQDTDF